MSTFLERLKNVCAMLPLSLLFVGPFIYLIFLCIPILWPFLIAYLFWLLFDRKTPKRGSRYSERVRRWWLWKMGAEYFPIKIVKTAELPVERNYLFGVHPHGVSPANSGLVFATDGTDFQTMFPGIRVNLSTLSYGFYIPILREIMLALGVITVHAESIDHVLSKSPPGGNAVAIVVGGLAEQWLGLHKLVLARRKGFVKMAIKHGADLVPVYHFNLGEQELHSRVENPTGKTMKILKSILKGHLGLIYGRSLLSIILPEEWEGNLPDILRYGLFPFSKSNMTVVGAPIHVNQNLEPSQEEIDAVHTEYCAQLRALFDAHKCEQGGLPESAELELI